MVPMDKGVIIKSGNSILREKARQVALEEIRSERIKKIIELMSNALRKTPDGIGIAAPQIGVSLRIFIASEEAYQASEHLDIDKKPKDAWKHYVFINPEVIKISRKKVSSQEGCLSVSGVYGSVARSEKIKVAAYNEEGKKFERGTTGLFARLLQHEIDHLNGVLFIDKAEKLTKSREKNGKSKNRISRNA